MPGRAAQKSASLGVLMFPLLPKQDLAIAKYPALPGDAGTWATCWHCLRQVAPLFYQLAVPGQSSDFIWEEDKELPKEDAGASVLAAGCWLAAPLGLVTCPAPVPFSDGRIGFGSARWPGWLSEKRLVFVS